MCNFCDTHVNFNFLFEGFSHTIEICVVSLSSLGVVGLPSASIRLWSLTGFSGLWGLFGFGFVFRF